MGQDFFVGTYSRSGIFKLNFDNGVFSQVCHNDSFDNCSWLYKNNDIIYSIVEYSDNPMYNDGYLVARNLNLLPISSSFLHGKGPCHVVVDNTRNLLFVANYGNGSIDVFSLNSDGTINNSVYYKEFNKQSRIHFLKFSSDNHFLFAIDLGTDTIFSFEIIFNGNNLELKYFSKYSFPANSGPRHLELLDHSLFVITEKSCELYQLSFSDKLGFKFINCVSLLPDNITREQNYSGCSIKISNDKKFIYTTIRVHNSISVFDVSDLKLIQNISCNGKIPRDINFDNSEDYLFCANQESSNISIFERNKKTGCLTYHRSYPVNSPACITKADM